MVQLGVKTGRSRLMDWIRGLSGEKEKTWDFELIRHNKEMMARIFLAAIKKYNVELSQREMVDKNGVHIAEQIISPEGFKLVVGYHTDQITEEREVTAGTGVYVQKLTTTIYSNLVIGYNWQKELIVVIEVDADLNAYSGIYVFNRQNVFKVKHSWFSDMFHIYDRSENMIKNILTFISSNNRTTFMVDSEVNRELTDSSGKRVLIYMRQLEEREDFVNFFRKFAK